MVPLHIHAGTHASYTAWVPDCICDGTLRKGMNANEQIVQECKCHLDSDGNVRTEHFCFIAMERKVH